MTAPDDPDRTTDGLKQLLRVAWSSLANPLLTPAERREARNQLKQYGPELRRYLDLMDFKHSGPQKELLAENASYGFERPELRILG